MTRFDDLTNNSTIGTNGRYLVGSKKKENALKASKQIWEGGLVIVVAYAGTNYVKITDGAHTFAQLASEGGAPSVTSEEISDASSIGKQILTAPSEADVISDIGAIPLSQKGQVPNGIPSLDANSKITAEYFSFGGIGDVAGPLDSTGKIPSSQVPVANPTGSVGLTAVNGVATTFMRSDASPALNQAITPTWTASHKFTAISTDVAPTVQLSSTTPELDFSVSNGAVDAKRWNWIGGLSTLSLRTLNDAGTTGSNAWTLSRTANAVTEQQWFISNVQKLNLTNTVFQSNVPTYNITGTDGTKLWLAKYSDGAGHSNAPTAIGATSSYLQIGGREYGNNGYGGIGFSYVGTPADQPAVWIGWQEKNTTGSTNGDFIIATRTTTTNVAPTERMRITAAGDTTFTNNVNVTGTLGSGSTAGTPSPTNSGITLGGAPTWAMQSFYDQANAANNRTADLLFIANSIKFRFVNDARNAFLDVFSINGGQALGVTGITSTSGSGNWAHTGGFTTTAPAVLSSGYTIATLPAASTALRGARSFVTDGTAPTFMGALGATGTEVVPVFCNGTAWVYA